MVILELNGVTKYFGGLAAVRGFDMSVEKGEVRSLIGPNGAGKTTMYNLITGFFPVTKGSIKYKGEEITGMKSHQIAQRGLVRTFQAADILFMDHTVLDSLMVARHLQAGMSAFRQYIGVHKRVEKENAEKCMEILDFFGLAEFKDEMTVNLPHGYQRALGVAMAIATEPEMLMLDEPVTGMNPTETDEFMVQIKKVRDRGITLLLVEHDMKAVMGISDSITVLSFGKKLAEGTPKEIAQNEKVIEAYLGSGEFTSGRK